MLFVCLWCELNETMSLYCAVPENIHVYSKEGHWKLWGEGVLKAKLFEGKYEAKLQNLEGGVGVQTKYFSWVGGSVNVFWKNALLLARGILHVIYPYLPKYSFPVVTTACPASYTGKCYSVANTSDVTGNLDCSICDLFNLMMTLTRIYYLPIYLKYFEDLTEQWFSWMTRSTRAGSLSSREVMRPKTEKEKFVAS